MAWPPILVRYGEIGIKSRSVRSQFERRLVDRIEEQLERRGVESEITRDAGRVYVRATNVDDALDALVHTFGVVSVSPALECSPTPEAVAASVLDVAKKALQPGSSFAVRVKRSGTHDFTSLDVAKACAARILDDLDDRKPTVDLDHPDFEVRVEVRDGEGFVFTRTLRGPGGLPLGSQGRVGVLVDGPRAAHAAWLMGKRGSALAFITTHDTAQADAWLEPLAPWVPVRRVHSLGDDGETPEPAMLASFLEKHKCQALVRTGGVAESLGQHEWDTILGMPVFRPLVGYSGERFAGLCATAALPEVA